MKSSLLKVDFQIKTKAYDQIYEPFKNSWIMSNLYKFIMSLYALLLEPLLSILLKGMDGVLHYVNQLKIVKKIDSAMSQSIIVQTLSGPFERKREALIMLPCLYLFIDYILRAILDIPKLSSTWDELLMILLFWVFLSRKDRSPLSSNATDDAKSLILLYVVLGIMRLFYKLDNPVVSIEGFRSIYQYVLWFFFVVALLNKKEKICLMDHFLALNGLFLGLHGSYQFIAGVRMLGNWVDNTEMIQSRAYSIMYNPNALGAIFMLLIPVVLAKLITSKSEIRKIYFGLSLISMIMGLVFTMSRGAWLGLLLSLGIFIIILNGKLLIHFILVGMGGFMALGFVRNRIFYMLSKEYLFRSADGGRFSKWAGAIKVWADHKIMGVGYGQYGSAVAVKYNISDTYVDGYYVKLLAETGLWGLLSFILLSLGLIYLILRAIKEESSLERKIMKIGYGSAIIAVLGQCSVESLLEIPVIASYFWIIIGMFFAQDVLQKQEIKNSKAVKDPLVH